MVHLCFDNGKCCSNTVVVRVCAIRTSPMDAVRNSNQSLSDYDWICGIRRVTALTIDQLIFSVT